MAVLLIATDVAQTTIVDRIAENLGRDVPSSAIVGRVFVSRATEFREIARLFERQRRVQPHLKWNQAVCDLLKADGRQLEMIGNRIDAKDELDIKLIEISGKPPFSF